MLLTLNGLVIFDFLYPILANILSIFFQKALFYSLFVLRFTILIVWRVAYENCVLMFLVRCI